ncbi:DUF2017 domain-containing protein [Allostreptomyces psammosilenae]|uniref:DUF2017 domain-containing protein n=1 Tax=Allostreptomyces psammosilenae TaxID=1892865 RepID=A0A853ACF9_9ACTN|nr:DUF2017 domain-containing protein [Allostreptomyces psammosilenae]NYI08148.1 hypothetical protein [Allostreptomyces psammosilenae]
MPAHFQPTEDGGAAILLDRIEFSILRRFAVQMLELLGPGEEERGDADDPFARLFAEGPSRAPEDPVLARLLPDAYPDDPDAAAEFRRFTENDLRDTKRAAALGIVRDLDAAGRDVLRVTRSGGPRAAEGGEDEEGEGEELDHLGGAEPSEMVLLRLDPEGVQRWLRGLNDQRLALGTWLGVTQGEPELDHLPDDDPHRPLAIAYRWLALLQDTLVETQLR